MIASLKLLLLVETVPVLVKLIAPALRRSMPPVTVPLFVPLIAPPTPNAEIRPFCVPRLSKVKLFAGLPVSFILPSNRKSTFAPAVPTAPLLV